MMTVEDDGVGRKPSAAQSPSGGTAKTSLGTAITRERLDMFGKQRQGPAGFRYTDLLHGTRVEVEMPIATV
ncbi:MAG: hypothetical protein IPI07_17135 [Flavobacteriales bacterium]|nr:hypothetical protein [Flavobacteriales bacterium]